MKVDDMPHESFKGKDAQLETAVQHLQKLIKEEPVDTPPIPNIQSKQLIISKKNKVKRQSFNL
jgi:tricorn protease